MPSYFFKETKNGIIVTSNKITNKLQYWSGPDILTLFDYPIGLNLQGRSSTELISWIFLPEIKFGFFKIENPTELKYEFGDQIPVTITNKRCKKEFFPSYAAVFWANPD